MEFWFGLCTLAWKIFFTLNEYDETFTNIMYTNLHKDLQERTFLNKNTK